MAHQGHAKHRRMAAFLTALGYVLPLILLGIALAFGDKRPR